MRKNLFFSVLFVCFIWCQEERQDKLPLCSYCTAPWWISFSDPSLKPEFLLSLSLLQWKGSDLTAMLEARKFLRQKRKKLKRAYDSQGDIRDHHTWKGVKNGLYEKMACLNRSNFANCGKTQVECMEDPVSVEILGKPQTEHLTFCLYMLDKLYGTEVKSWFKVFQASICSYPVKKRENLQYMTTKCHISIRCLRYLHYGGLRIKKLIHWIWLIRK